MKTFYYLQMLVLFKRIYCFKIIILFTINMMPLKIVISNQPSNTFLHSLKKLTLELNFCLKPIHCNDRETGLNYPEWGKTKKTLDKFCHKIFKVPNHQL